MYLKFYGLKEKPFELTPDSGVVYLSEAHREALAVLRYGIISDKGFLMLTGGIGTGKTTMLNSLLQMVDDSVSVCLLNNPTLTRQEFYHFLAAKLGLGFGGNKAEFVLQFSELLQSYRERKQKILLIIDEAQVFPRTLLEEVRLLSNQAGEDNVLSIFLVGQPELQQVISHPRLLPLRQRVGVTYHLREFGRNDTAHYIAYRLNKAGAVNQTIFSDEAVELIHRASSGNPRLINIICDHALISGYSRDEKIITVEIIEECIEELRLPGEAGLALSPGAGQKQEKHGARRPREWWLNIGAALMLVLGLSATGGFLFYYLGWITW